MHPAWKHVLAFAAALAAASCAAPELGPPQTANEAREREVNRNMLVSLDTNGDNLLSRDEMEVGLQHDFALLDVSSDQFLDRTETANENNRRWNENGSSSSPLIDWNQDGLIDFAEFAATPRATFNQLDIDRSGSLSEAELAGRAGRRPPI